MAKKSDKQKKPKKKAFNIPSGEPYFLISADWIAAYQEKLRAEKNDK